MGEITNAKDFARISADLLSEPHEPATLRSIVERAVEVVPGCDYSSMSLRMRGGSVQTPVSTSTIVESVCDALQYNLREGPCLQAIWNEELYLVNDLATDERFPKWGPAAAAEGAGSILSVRLFTNAQVMGALNLYAGKPFSFDNDDVEVAVVYASHAAVALSAAKVVTDLNTAVLTRHLIGMAQGILMNRYGINQERAFEVLRRYSSHSNTKLRDVAQSVVDSGSLPTEDPRTATASARKGRGAHPGRSSLALVHGRGEQPAGGPTAAAVFALAYVGFVAFMVFWPSERYAGGSVSLASDLLHRIGVLGWVSPALVETLANVVLFLPLRGPRRVPAPAPLGAALGGGQPYVLQPDRAGPAGAALRTRGQRPRCAGQHPRCRHRGGDRADIAHLRRDHAPAEHAQPPDLEMMEP